MSGWREKLAARQALVPKETLAKPIELPKIFMVRHLERIDYSDNPSSKEFKEWLSQKSDYNYLINPYLDAEISIGRLRENLEEKHIDHVICSPYMRCIQTGILITNSPDLNIVDKTIHIDYKLGELVNEIFSFRVPLDVETVYTHSKKYIEEKFNTMTLSLDNSNNTPLIFTDYETDEQYDKRILDELTNIRERYSGNILVITHADAYKQFNAERKGMDYGRVYNINLGVGGSYREKYLKYKTKYMELKQNLQTKKI